MGNITRTLANNLTSSLGAGGGSGMHTLLNTYNAAGISTDLEMDFPVNGGTYNKFRILIDSKILRAPSAVISAVYSGISNETLTCDMAPKL